VETLVGKTQRRERCEKKRPETQGSKKVSRRRTKFPRTAGGRWTTKSKNKTSRGRGGTAGGDVCGRRGTTPEKVGTHQPVGVKEKVALKESEGDTARSNITNWTRAKRTPKFFSETQNGR